MVPYDFTSKGRLADWHQYPTITTMTGEGRGFCAGLLTFPSDSISACREVGRRRLGTEQFRPAIAFCLSDHDYRDELLFSLFQVL